LKEQARAEGVKLDGPGGVLSDVTTRVLETALEGGMDAHLGYAKHDPTGRNGGNSRTPSTWCFQRPRQDSNLRRTV